MCYNPSTAWAMVQTMRAIVREGELTCTARQALCEHRLDALADFLPLLVELLQADRQQGKGIATDQAALPTAMERCLLDATACSRRDPDRSRWMLMQHLNPAAAERVEDIVTAIACALEDAGCQRQRRASAMPASQPDLLQ